MSKRLIRIGSGKVQPALQSLLNHEISAILENGKTYFGRLVSFSTGKLLLTDTRNHPHDISIADLYEIIYDSAQNNTTK
jgi:small nuclear ribonucleoprotein (snRNP)-like protein